MHVNVVELSLIWSLKVDNHSILSLLATFVKHQMLRAHDRVGFLVVDCTDFKTLSSGTFGSQNKLVAPYFLLIQVRYHSFKHF